MNKFSVFITLIIIVLASLNINSMASDNAEPSKVNFKGEELPEMLLFVGFKMNVYFAEDNDYTLIEEDAKKIDAIAEYLKVNPLQSFLMKGYQHENENKETTKKRCEAVKERLLQSGIKAERIMYKLARPVLAQNEDDIFTPEELTEARRVEIQIVR